MEDFLLLESNLQKLIDYDAVELYVRPKEEGTKVFLPYIINDGIECYWVFENCNIQGEWIENASAIDFSLTEDGKRKGLLIRQENGNTVSIWYENTYRVRELYQYHRIGHFWIKGYEEWRRLVYIAGTIYDKNAFVGEDTCNALEKEIIPLMEFAPFTYWTPLKEDIIDCYELSQNGIDAVKAMAAKIDDPSLLRLASKYERELLGKSLTIKKIEKYAIKLTKHMKLYDYLNEIIDKASESYSERIYSEEETRLLKHLRDMAEATLRAEGYEGSYPYMEKGRRKAVFYEELPYVMRDFEYDDYDFKVQHLILKRKGLK